MRYSSKLFRGIAVAAALCEPALASPGRSVPGFQVVSPPRVVLRPVQPRAMTRGTRAVLQHQRRDGRGKDRRGVYGAVGGVYGVYDGGPTDIAGAMAPEPYVIPGQPPRPACLGPGPLIIEVGKPLQVPANLPRVVYGTPTPICPPGY